MAPKLKRPMYGPGHPTKPATVGKDVQIAKFAVGRYEKGLLPKPPKGYTKVFGTGLERALEKVVQPQEGIRATGDIGQATWDVLWEYLDAYRRLQYRTWNPPAPPPPPPAVPDLGPVWSGGISILYHDLTHETAGVPGYPAFDDGWMAGRYVIAPEDLRVIEQSGSLGGDAFFAEGESKIKYWFGHLALAPYTGKKFKKGERMGVIANIPVSQGGPHVHTGIDARPLIGKELEHHTDYTHGAPTVGRQLREALSMTAR